LTLFSETGIFPGMESPCSIRFPDGQRLPGVVVSRRDCGRDVTLEVMVEGQASTAGQCYIDFPGLEHRVKVDLLWAHKAVSKFRVEAFAEK